MNTATLTEAPATLQEPRQLEPRLPMREAETFPSLERPKGNEPLGAPVVQVVIATLVIGYLTFMLGWAIELGPIALTFFFGWVSYLTTLTLLVWRSGTDAGSTRPQTH